MLQNRIMSTEMDYELNLEPSDVKFLEKLKQGENSAIFKVLVHDKICVLKVYRGRARCEFSSPDTEYNLFICESSAYKRLKARGLCDKKVIPDFYGTIKQIQPSRWPDLYPIFCDDELLPDAVLIEYIPFLRELDLDTYSESRLIKLRQILHEIHEARVVHHDPYPRNMMISLEPGKEGEKGKERVLWMDFDSAQTFPENGPLSPLHEEWLSHEKRRLDYFFKHLALDYADGKLSRVWSYYYTRG